MDNKPVTGVKYYTLEEIIDIKNECDRTGQPVPFGFDTHPMLFTDPHSHEVVEVFAQDVIVDIGHKVDDRKYSGTTTTYTDSNELIIKTKDGQTLDWKTATPYYRVELSVLQNNKFSPDFEISKGYWFKKECLGKPGCHFDWNLVSCTNISRLDGGK